jgi:endogenous inhibitor of DNA gyrase (YacG/DUF329 family)
MHRRWGFSFVAEVVTFLKRKPCAICGKPSEPKFHPFCSNRCREVDLNRWLGGHYAIPAVEQDDDNMPETPESSD